MAAAAEPGGRPVKRSRSLEFLPPDMSELRIVLLGSSWSQRNSVEKSILDNNNFNTEPLSCTRNTSRFRNKHVTVINTPELLSPTQDKLNEFLKYCARVSYPGPHVFLLVLHPEDFNEDHKEKFCRILETYNDQSFDRCLILVTPREKSSGLRETHMENKTLKEMIRKCRYRHLKMSDIKRAELLTRLGQVAKENNGERLTYEVIEETTSPVSSSSAATIRKFNDTDGKEVKLGDLIQIFCRVYQDWAVYVGDGDVVTFFPNGSVTGVVVKHKLEHVVEKWRVNNRLDHKYPPRPANDIVKEACSLVDTEMQWDLYTYNEEHFATDMRYGKPESQQPSLLHDGVTLIKIQRFRSADVVPAPLW
ncbi:GTPase IMAP family member 5-like [Cololabis saira]|uniref:GTPase IMAP family member 5-like n=1 Tax=Cololabis saira TaxID=129043 RepID=UPI002AD1D3C5|nr:GTPase IMAP family member 5-like [Cololabis saira]